MMLSERMKALQSFRFPKPLLVIDTETTGLKLACHRIIQLAGVIADPHTLEPIKQFCTYIRANEVDYTYASKRALLTHNITLKQTTSAPSWPSAWSQFQEALFPDGHIDDYLVSGYNIKRFDLPMIQRMAEIYRMDHLWRQIQYRDFMSIDFWDIAMGITAFNGMKIASKWAGLEKTAKALNIKPKHSHDALDDCLTTLEVMKALGTIANRRLFK